MNISNKKGGTKLNKESSVLMEKLKQKAKEIVGFYNLYSGEQGEKKQPNHKKNGSEVNLHAKNIEKMYAKWKAAPTTIVKQRLIKSTSSGAISPNDTATEKKHILSAVNSPKSKFKKALQIPLVNSFMSKHHTVKSNPQIISPTRPLKEVISHIINEEGSVGRKSMQHSKAKFIISKSPIQGSNDRKTGGAASALAIRHPSPNMSTSLLATHNFKNIISNNLKARKVPKGKLLVNFSLERERIKTPVPPNNDSISKVIANQYGKHKEFTSLGNIHLLSNSELLDTSEPRTARILTKKQEARIENIKTPTNKPREISFGFKRDIRKKSEIKNILSPTSALAHKFSIGRKPENPQHCSQCINYNFYL